jgi:hypothetical protein
MDKTKYIVVKKFEFDIKTNKTTAILLSGSTGPEFATLEHAVASIMSQNGSGFTIYKKIGWKVNEDEINL